MSKSTILTNWHPASWRGLPATQQPAYADPVALERAVGSTGVAGRLAGDTFGVYLANTNCYPGTNLNSAFNT